VLEAENDGEEETLQLLRGFKNLRFRFVVEENYGTARSRPIRR